MTNTPSAESVVLDYLAESGEYYDSIEDIPNDILAGNARAQERILSNPEQFPLANIQRIEGVYSSFIAACAGRLLLI